MADSIPRVEPELRPRAPFVGWSRQWTRPAYGFVWVVENPAAMITQSVFENGTRVAIEALHDVIDEVVALGFLAQNPGALVIHDWRTIRSIAPGGRDTWARRSDRPGKPFSVVGTSYVAVSASSMLRMAIQTGALAVQLATGQPPIKVVDDPATPMAAHGIKAPARDLLARLRAR